MFHLFKRVYLDHDINVSINVKRVVLSEMAGFNLDEKYKDTLGNLLLFNTPSPTEMSSEDFCALLRRLWMLEEKVVIFCDAGTYARIVAWWLKSIVQGEALNVYRLLVQSIDLRELAEWGFKRHPRILNRDVDVDAVWTNTNGCDTLREFVKEHVASISAEYQLMRYLLGDESCEEHVRSAIELIIERTLVDYARERREKEYMATFARMGESDVLEMLAAGGEGMLADLVVREMSFEWDADSAIDVLHTPLGDDEDSEQFRVLVEGIYLKNRTLDEIVDAFVHLSATCNPELSVISSGDVGNFNFPFMVGLAQHRTALLKDVTL